MEMLVLCKSNFLDKNSKFLSKNKRFENSNCFLKKLYFYKAPLILCLGKFIKILLKMLAVGWSRLIHEMLVPKKLFSGYIY